ncbi:WLM-domain-containing protein [Neoconidiobolus thromboides FSU 785]|nr:WLM-domain-containing protein [Neoconidiobolus thromboides FSU 785]
MGKARRRVQVKTKKKVDINSKGPFVAKNAIKVNLDEKNEVEENEVETHEVKQLISKKMKRKLKHEEFKKKFEKKNLNKSGVLNDFGSLRKTIKEIKQASDGNKESKNNEYFNENRMDNNKKLNKARKMEMERFNLVLNHNAFVNDPLKTVQMHLANTIFNSSIFDLFWFKSKALKNRQDEDKANEILIKLAKHVEPIMKKRDWNVGKLKEFYPKKLLLGMNVNKTEVIYIRLREINDFKVFINYWDLLGTLLHELVHIIHGPHDQKFYELLMELKYEVVKIINELNRSNLKETGYKLGGTITTKKYFYGKGNRLSEITDSKASLIVGKKYTLVSHDLRIFFQRFKPFSNPCSEDSESIVIENHSNNNENNVIDLISDEENELNNSNITKNVKYATK